MSKSKKFTPYYGLLETEKGMDVIIDEGEKVLTPQRNFVDTFEEYCSKTIINEKAVVIALHQVKAEC